jgi:hypothetical protein
MIITKHLRQCHALLFCVSLLFLPASHAATKWQQPTQEELTMTSQPEVPGAQAVILFREETVDDANSTWSYYWRIKILNEGGRDRYSNISIEYPSRSPDNGFTITEIAARTIHPDGTIIAFTGNPFDRLVESSSAGTTREKVFTLPDVQVGSIIEYHYTVQLNPDVLPYSTFFSGTFIPTFYVQTDLFARKEHFLWHTKQRPVAFTSGLPGGPSAIKVKEVDPDQHYSNYTIDIANVLPVPDEPYMPPLSNLVQKVVFYTNLPDNIKNAQNYWDHYGKIWSKNIDDFIGPPSKLAAAAAEITAGASTPEEKLRKIYATVQQMENTNFSRERSAREKKVIGVFNPKSANDVLQEKRGDDLQLSILFVGLVRAASMKAYIMAVSNRDIGLFNPQLTTFQQLNDDIAIVELDGKDFFFDPAEPLCAFGQLFWPHSYAGGLRQTASGVSFATSPAPTYKQSETHRVANLTIDPTGHESGTVDLWFIGAPALRWRQSLLLGDETALHKDLEAYLQDRFPASTEVALQTIDNLHDSEKPLIVHFQVSGPLGSLAGKSRLIPTQLFQLNQHVPFTEAKRTLAIDFAYPERILDGVRLQLPSTWQIDNPPTPENYSVSTLPAAYAAHAQLSANAIILHRDYILGATVVEPNSYPDLRNFYNEVASKDQEQLLVHIKPASTVTPNPAP